LKEAVRFGEIPMVSQSTESKRMLKWHLLSTDKNVSMQNVKQNGKYCLLTAMKTSKHFWPSLTHKKKENNKRVEHQHSRKVWFLSKSNK